MDTRIAYLNSLGYLKIPRNLIEETNTINAMATKFYGPIWFSLFLMIMGRYPVKMDWEDEEQVMLSKHFYNLLTGLQYTLPCKFCRESFKGFMKELDIKQFMDTRIRMTLWLYLMKDKVNEKLIGQESEYKERIQGMYKRGEISKQEFLREKKMCFKTTPTPPFKDILKYYGKYRATCSKKIQKCVGKGQDLNF